MTIFADRVEVAGFQAGREFVPTIEGIGLVAHAGGGTSGGRHSNSLEAIEKAHAAGFSWFEVDLSFTSDGELVLLHDWAATWRYWFGGSSAGRLIGRLTPNSPVSLEAFKEASMRGDRTQLSFSSLCNWMMERPDTVFFLDPKDHPERILEAVAARCRQGLGQFVWLTPDPEIAALARQLGIDRIALSTFHNALDFGEAESLARTGGFDFVAMSVFNFGLDELRQAASWGPPIVVSTINSQQMAQGLAEAGIAAIITDTLRPPEADR